MARLVPSLERAPRLNKVVIVNKTVEHLQEQRNMCMAAGRDMQDLLAENRRLVSELSALRAQVGSTSTFPVEPRPITPAMEKLLGVENQLLGACPTGFEDQRAIESGECFDSCNKAGTGDRDLPLLIGDFVPPLGQAHLTERSESNTPWSAVPNLISTSWYQECEIPWDSIPWPCDATEGYIG